MITYQQILHAQALLEFGSFRKAAYSQNISQPAFSRSIGRLEDSLGVKLFFRHPTGVAPTVYGKILEKYGQTISTAIFELKREILIAQGLGTGELSVAMGPYPAEISGHRAIGRLLSKYPEIRCKVTVSEWHDAEKLVISHSADIGFAEISEAQKNKYLTTEPVSNHPVVFFCRTGHPLTQKEKVNLNDLKKYPIVLIKIPARLRALIPGKIFPIEGSDFMAPSVDVQDLALSRQIIMECEAFGAATLYQIKDALELGVFTIIPIHEPWMALNYGFFYVKDRALSPAAETYMDLVREIEADVERKNNYLMEKYGFS